MEPERISQKKTTFSYFFFYKPISSTHIPGASGGRVAYLGRCEHQSFPWIPGHCQTMLPVGLGASVTSWWKEY